jgi:apolipoprotein N-acyltransferase
MAFLHKKERILHLLAATVLGLIWSLAYPSWSMTGFAWLIPASLIFISHSKSGRGHFLWGFFTGWIHCATALYWLLQMPYLPGALAAWFFLSCYVACYPGLWCWIVWRGIRSETPQRDSLIKSFILPNLRNMTLFRAQTFAICAASLWVALEFAVSNLLTGFPWLLLGSTQLPNTPFVQSASLAGVPLISFVMVWASVSTGIGLSRLQLHRRNPWRWIPDTILPLCFVTILTLFGYQRIGSMDANVPSSSLNIALIQPNFPQDLIWDHQKSQVQFKELIRLSEAALQTNPDILVWPESALPADIKSFEPVWDLLKKHKVWLCFNGTDIRRKAPDDGTVLMYNAAFLMDPDGILQGTYHKRHLVMFGEFVPFSKWFPFLKRLTPLEGMFTPGTQAKWFHVSEHAAHLFPLICFEDVMPELAREAGRAKTDFLINMTNDGWFGESSAQLQHASLAAFRCIENGLPMVRCGNNGLTCWIDPAGRRHAMGSLEDLHGRGFKIVQVPKQWKVDTTFYQKTGNLFAWICVGISLSWFPRIFRKGMRANRA